MESKKVSGKSFRDTFFVEDIEFTAEEAMLHRWIRPLRPIIQPLIGLIRPQEQLIQPQK